MTYRYWCGPASRRRMWLILALATISLGLSAGCGLIIERTEPVEIVLKNELSTPIQNASVRLSKDKQGKDFPLVLPGHSASITIDLPTENNLEFAFTSGTANLRHVTIIPAGAQLKPLAVTIRKDGTCWYRDRESGADSQASEGWVNDQRTR